MKDLLKENYRLVAVSYTHLDVYKRQVQDIISRLITRYSIPIVGVRNGAFRGYFIPANQEELLDGAKAFYNQVQEEQKRLNVLLNADLESYKPLLKGDNEYV